MARSLTQITVRALLAIAALTAGSLAAGCTAQIESGDGTGGSGGAAAADCTEGEMRPCENGMLQVCSLNEDGEPTWGECNVSGSSTTPLVLSFDRAPVQFAASAYSFDLTGTMSAATDWPTAETPWLALDRDGNGVIDGGAELFGSATVLAGGERAENGFIALRELDSNGDGRITPADAAWSKLLLWSDRDADRASAAAELASVSSRKLLSIELGYTQSPRCDGRGNCEIERATFRYLDDAGVERAGDVIDVHLKFQ